MWWKCNAQHPSRVLYVPFLNCNSHTHMVVIYKLRLGKIRISSHLELKYQIFFPQLTSSFLTFLQLIAIFYGNSIFLANI